MASQCKHSSFRKSPLRQRLGGAPKDKATIQGLHHELCTSPLASNDEHLKALIEDLSGQVSEAFSRAEWYDKWGFRYIPSLLSAHKLQQVPLA